MGDRLSLSPRGRRTRITSSTSKCSLHADMERQTSQQGLSGPGVTVVGTEDRCRDTVGEWAQEAAGLPSRQGLGTRPAVFGLEFFDLGMIKRPFSGHFQNGVICLPTQNTEGSPEWRAWRRGTVDGRDHRRCRSWTSPLPLHFTCLQSPTVVTLKVP